GIARPLSINVDTFGTGKAEDTDIQQVLEAEEIFNFRPAEIIRDLELTTPRGWSYRDTAVAGHFGREKFSWERTDRVEALLEALDLAVEEVA
ncbi:MAG: methionine adenosyltransferase domain-containing protein, partial [Desulfopila sp.]|nr:methionine adenosyltransferase domain-containing protein [Desulfopila sp.]